MKFPSIKSLAEGAKNTFLRFPVELLFAFAGTAGAIANIELNNVNAVAEAWCTRITMTGNLGLLLSLSATLFTESRGIKGKKRIAIKAAAVAIAILLLFLLNPELNEADYIRFGLLSLSFHLLVAYAAFTAKGHIQGFWQFNKTLFLRFLTSALYGTVLYAGLAAALGAMNLLFNFKFEFDTFSILWVCIVGIFTTAFFLAGVPANYAELQDDLSYPKGLKVFTQYVLIPLASIYLLILISYEIKILVQWSLPKGYVSNLILGYAVFGILSLLLVYPIREREENKWLKTYARSFYFLMIPLLVLLFVAVGARVFKYGITESRYFLIILAFWLLFISGYFLLFKKQNIKLIPISLSIITLAAIYGPQSAFSVSKFSQTRILINIFKKHNAFKDGKLVKVSKIDSADGSNALDKLRYLVTQHDLVSLQPYISKDLKALSDSIAQEKGLYSDRFFTVNKYELKERKINWATKYLGLSKYDLRGYAQAYEGFNSNDTHLFKTNNIVNIKGYDYMVDINQADSGVMQFEDLKIKRKVLDYTNVIININGEEVNYVDTVLADQLLKNKNINRYLVKIKNGAYDNEYLVPPALLTLTKQTGHYKVTLVLDNFSFGKAKKEAIKSMDVGGVYLIKKL